MFAAGKQVLVVGTARNCARHLRADIERLQAAFPGVHLSWLIVESDSSDQTVALLHSLRQQMERFSFLSLGALSAAMPQRTGRLAHCRNAYAEQIRANPAYAGVDYVVVADFDGINARIGPEAVASCGARDDWDVVAANQAGPYFDIWALRHRDWCPGDCWAEYRFLTGHGLGEERALAAAVHARMITLPPDGDWVEVDSAFGGLAIYRKSMFDLASYAGTIDGVPCCEHVPFHQALRHQGRRIFINPALVNGGLSEHTEPLLFRNRLVRRTKGLVRKVFRSHVRHFDV